MASLERDMRAGWGTKAHAEATRHASTRNSAPGTETRVCARACTGIKQEAKVWLARARWGSPTKHALDMGVD
eukprot:scaffold47230_cov63-Phaeocystis_antarctica.AAC.6